MSTTINLSVSQQHSFVATKRIPVAGTTGFYTVHPLFDDEWSVATSTIIVFAWTKTTKYGAAPVCKVGIEWDGENDVTIPQSVVAEPGTLAIGAIGMNEAGTTVITTNADEGVITVVDAIAASTDELTGDSEDDADIWAVVTSAIEEINETLLTKMDTFTVSDGLDLTDSVLSVIPATTNTLGGIIVGENLSIDDDGVLSADAQPAILYSETGENTDGAMTQKATTDELATKQDILTAGDGIIIEDNEVSIDTDTIAQVADIPQQTSDLENDGADGSDPYVAASDLAAVQAEIPTTVAELSDSSDYVTQTELTEAISSVYTYQGSVETYDDLPTSDLTVGDVYNVEEAYGTIPAGTNYAWNGTEWDALAGSVDLSSYATITYVDEQVGDIETILETLTTGTGV